MHRTVQIEYDGMGGDVSGGGCKPLGGIATVICNAGVSDPSFPSSFEYGQDTSLPHWRHVLKSGVPRTTMVSSILARRNLKR